MKIIIKHEQWIVSKDSRSNTYNTYMHVAKNFKVMAQKQIKQSRPNEFI